MSRWPALPVVILAVLAVGGSGLLGDPAMWGVDARSYRPLDQAHPYVPGVWGLVNAYQYAPAFAQALAPLRSLPWDAFVLLWTALGSAALVWLTGWASVPLALAPMVTREVWYGNVHLPLAVALVAGFRRPWAWAFVLLTKVTPGVCLLWFVARRDWRSLRIALGATGIVVAISWVLAPWMWSEWVALLGDLSGRPAPTATALPLGPLWIRVGAAGVIALLAGWAGLRWPLAVALTLALPSVWFAGLSMLVALLPLARMDRSDPLPATWPAPPLRRLVGAAPVTR